MIHGGLQKKQRAQDQACVDNLILRIRDSGHDGRLGVIFRENLPCFLSGETEALKIFLKTSLWKISNAMALVRRYAMEK